MNICVVGAGKIGGTLGKKWVEAGHAVRFGVRSPEDPKFDDLRPLGPVASIPEALGDFEVILLSLPGSALADFAGQYAASLEGKTIIDATNNVRSPVMNNLGVLQKAVPSAPLIRAFSSLGWENFAEPQLGGQTIDLFYCASPDSRPTAEQLINDVGLRPVYLGGIDAADLVDGMTQMWFALAIGQGRGRRIAFKLLEP